MMHGLSGVHSEVGLLLWANRHGQLLHRFVEARLNEIRSSQMTEVDESIMYHAQSFTEEPEFSDADEDELFHAQSQEQQRPAPTASPNVRAPTPTTESTSERSTDPPAPRPHHFTTGFEDQQEPSVLQGSDDTVILPVEFSPLMTSSQFENLIADQSLSSRIKPAWMTSYSLHRRSPRDRETSYSLHRRSPRDRETSYSLLHRSPRDRKVSPVLPEQILYTTLPCLLALNSNGIPLKKTKYVQKPNPAIRPLRPRSRPTNHPPLLPFLQLKTICKGT